MYAQPYLQKYKGISTRHTCPQCGKKQSFTLYFDGNTHQPINSKVGKCNRESKCGYHYTPKQFFIDNPDLNETTSQDCDLHYSKPFVAKQQTVQPIGTIPFTYVERSASYKSNFVRFLFEILTDSQIQSIVEKYALGATKNQEVIFWQIDTKQCVRTGKIMQYNALTGKRIKHESGAIDWVHNKLKKSGTLPEDYNLQQCFFGEHLLGLHPEAIVCIVESEKSALISAAIFPEQVWLATGGIGNLSIEKCQVLKNRNIILYPDLNGYNKWLDKAIEIEKQCSCNISVSTLLEDIATPEAKAKGLDIADYMIVELKTKTNQKQIQTRFTPELQTMIDTNSALLTLIDKLQLQET
ncbi:MAG: hypothetical protein KA303_03110 [Paludibacter sp.]|nr:hypothetical protein [Paludibacter sp.]